MEGYENLQFPKCVPLDKVNIEYSIFWSSFADYLNNHNTKCIDLILPELSTFCEYLAKFHRMKATTLISDWKIREHQHTFNNLISILEYFDLSDEIGCRNLKNLASKLIRGGDELHEKSIEILIRRVEEIIPDKEERFQFFEDIIRDLCNTNEFEFIDDQPVIAQLIRNDNSNIQIEISRLKVKIMDFQEQITNFMENKNYDAVQQITEKLKIAISEYNQHLIPILNNLPENEAKIHQLNLLNTEKQQLSNVTKGLKSIFYLVASEKVSSLTLSIRPFYNDFIRPQIDSIQLEIRNWALKCATSFGLLYDSLAHDVFIQLAKQFSQTKNIQIWVTASQALFSLFAKYGLKYFEMDTHQNRRASAKNSRQLFRGNNTDCYSQDEEDESESVDDILQMLSHILETCVHTTVQNAILKGYCLMCTHGNEAHPIIISKLMLKYFDPNTNTEAQQMLGIFFRTLIARSKLTWLEAALLPTVYQILHASYDSSLGEVKPSMVIKFVINATKPQGGSFREGYNIHDSICASFLRDIQDNIYTNISLVKILANELIFLSITPSPEMRSNYINLVTSIIDDDEHELDSKTLKNLNVFKSILEGKTKTQSTESNVQENEKTNDTNFNDYESSYESGDENKTDGEDKNETENGDNNFTEKVREKPLQPHSSDRILNNSIILNTDDNLSLTPSKVIGTLNEIERPMPNPHDEPLLTPNRNVILNQNLNSGKISSRIPMHVERATAPTTLTSKQLTPSKFVSPILQTDRRKSSSDNESQILIRISSPPKNQNAEEDIDKTSNEFVILSNPPESDILKTTSRQLQFDNESRVSEASPPSSLSELSDSSETPKAKRGRYLNSTLSENIKSLNSSISKETPSDDLTPSNQKTMRNNLLSFEPMRTTTRTPKSLPQSLNSKESETSRKSKRGRPSKSRESTNARPTSSQDSSSDHPSPSQVPQSPNLNESESSRKTKSGRPSKSQEKTSGRLSTSKKGTSGRLSSAQESSIGRPSRIPESAIGRPSNSQETSNNRPSSYRKSTSSQTSISQESPSGRPPRNRRTLPARFQTTNTSIIGSSQKSNEISEENITVSSRHSLNDASNTGIIESSQPSTTVTRIRPARSLSSTRKSKSNDDVIPSSQPLVTRSAAKSIGRPKRHKNK